MHVVARIQLLFITSNDFRSFDSFDSDVRVTILLLGRLVSEEDEEDEEEEEDDVKCFGIAERRVCLDGERED